MASYYYIDVLNMSDNRIENIPLKDYTKSIS